jgi:hypothetical protein
MTFKRLAHLLPALTLVVLLSMGLQSVCVADMTVVKEVTRRMDGEKSTFTQTTYWTKSKMRTDDPSGRVIITDLDREGILILVPKEKKYLEQSFEDVKKRQAALPEHVKKEIMGMKVSVRETDEKRTIDGYPCQKLIIKAGPRDITVWITKKIAIDPVVLEFDKKLLKLTKGIRSLSIQAEVRAVLEKRNAYPYITLAEAPLPFAGKTETSESKLKKVEYEKVDPSVFAIPADYERIVLPTAPPSK